VSAATRLVESKTLGWFINSKPYSINHSSTVITCKDCFINKLQNGELDAASNDFQSKAVRYAHSNQNTRTLPEVLVNRSKQCTWWVNYHQYLCLYIFNSVDISRDIAGSVGVDVCFFNQPCLWSYCRLGWFPQKRSFVDNWSRFIQADPLPVDQPSVSKYWRALAV